MELVENRYECQDLNVRVLLAEKHSAYYVMQPNRRTETLFENDEVPLLLLRCGRLFRGRTL